MEHKDASATRELAPLKKSIYSLIDLREILLGCNQRYLAFLSSLVGSTVPRTSRNDPCPCGSGKKYKYCCLDKDRTVELEPAVRQRIALQAQKANPVALQKDDQQELLESQAALLEAQALDAASNAVVDLVHAGHLDEAEQAARELLLRYPDVHDGYDRLGMVHEARGQFREAADCYRKVIEFARAHPADYDAAVVNSFLELIVKLEDSAAEAEPAVNDVGRPA